MTATTGTCVHIPPGFPHACILAHGETAGRMLMIYQPSGFDGYLAELAKMNEANFANKQKMADLND